MLRRFGAYLSPVPNLPDPPGSRPGLAAALAGRYTIERELGRGGNAVVYLARDLKHAPEVARAGPQG